VIKITIYILSFSTIFILGFLFNNYWNYTNKRKKFYLFLSFILLFLISAFRAENVGTDTSNYLRGFSNIKDATLTNIFEKERWESGYVILNKLVSFVSIKDQSILFFSSFIILLAIMYFIYKNSENVVLSLYLYISLYLYFFSFNGIRQAMAMSILAMGFHLIKERKLIKYLIIVSVASLFHVTAIIFSFFYFLYNLKLNIKNIVLLSLMFIFIFVFIEDIVFYILSYTKSLNYIDANDILEGSGLLFPLVNLSFLIYVLFIKINNKIKDPELDFYLLIIIIGFLATIIAMKLSVILRLNYYFQLFYIIAIPLSLKYVKQKNLKVLLIYLILTVTIIYFLVRLLNGWHEVLPYKMFS